MKNNKVIKNHNLIENIVSQVPQAKQSGLTRSKTAIATITTCGNRDLQEIRIGTNLGIATIDNREYRVVAEVFGTRKSDIAKLERIAERMGQFDHVITTEIGHGFHNITFYIAEDRITFAPGGTNA